MVTINLPKIAYLSKDEKDFYHRLDHLMDVSARSLKIKRTIITKLFDEGLYPYTKRYLDSFNNHFSTIGLIGMNEAGLNAGWIKADLTEEKAQEFAKEVLNHMRNRLSDYQEEYGDLYNLEATPAESTTYRLAKHDVASSRTSSRLLRMEEHHSTQTVLICLWDIRTMFSMRWIFRMNYRHYIHQGPFSTHSSERNFRIGKRPRLW